MFLRFTSKCLQTGTLPNDHRGTQELEIPQTASLTVPGENFRKTREHLQLQKDTRNRTEEKEHGRNPRSIDSRRNFATNLMRAKIIIAILKIKTKKECRRTGEWRLQLQRH